MIEVEYKFLLSNGKYIGYQSKKENKGIVKVNLSNLYNISYGFYSFVLNLIEIIIHERYCLERCFNKIRIKKGMCNPCCIRNLSKKTMELLYE